MEASSRFATQGVERRSILLPSCFGLLGFGCGLPYPLYGTTLGLWLFDSHPSVLLTSLFTWALIPYSLKPLWAKFIDTLRLPTFLRSKKPVLSWIIWSQFGCMISLLIVSYLLRTESIVPVFVFVTIGAFCGASQDCAIDSFRITLDNSFGNGDKLLTAYQIGYRAALFASDGILILLAHITGWSICYVIAASLMALPIVSTCIVASQASLNCASDFDVCILQKNNPLLFFFNIRNLFIDVTGSAWLFIGCYRLLDIFGGSFVNPSYVVMRLSDLDIAFLHSAVSLPASLLGLALSGYMSKRLGLYKLTVAAGLLQAAGYISFAICLNFHTGFFSLVIANVFIGLATSLTGFCLVMAISSLSSIDFPAFNYAVMIAIYLLTGKFFTLTFGFIIEYLRELVGFRFGLSSAILIASIISASSLLLAKETIEPKKAL